MAAPKLVRVQEKGRITLPAATRKRLGLNKGDLVAVKETSEGVLIVPQGVIAADALDQIGAVLREQSLSLDDLIEPGLICSPPPPHRTVHSLI
jgi:AbrB family looped-hinge helix DNA binding protein